jgi:hypothetical protein
MERKWKCLTCGSEISSDIEHICDQEVSKKEYTVVVRLTVSALIKDVTELINEGWTPFGSIAIDSTDERLEYLQPMIRYPTPPNYYRGKPIKVRKLNDEHPIVHDSNIVPP